MTDIHSLLLDAGLIGQLIDLIPSPVYYKDVDGRYLGCNRAFETSSGLDKKLLIGKVAASVHGDGLLLASISWRVVGFGQARPCGHDDGRASCEGLRSRTAAIGSHS